MKISHAIWACGLVLLPACLSPYLLPALYLELAGVVTEGQVTQKQESIQLRGDDLWRHVLEVTYRYTPADTRTAETGTHQVDPQLFDQLSVGSAVKVRYTPWRLPRSLHIVAMGSALADSTWLSRIPSESDSARLDFDLGTMAVAVLLTIVAWLRKTRAWILAAAFCGATVCSAIVTCGFVTFPILFGWWRKRPAQGYGWVLLGSIALSMAVLHARIPQPTPPPSTPSHEAIATVRQVESVDHIWKAWEDSGEQVPQPFQLADLEFTPAGANTPIHAVDRVDLNSLPELREGATVRVFYSSANPRSARIDGGTRTFTNKAFVYFLQMTFGIGILLTMVVMAMLLAEQALGLLWRRITGFSPDQIAHIGHNVSRFPAEDPRRKAVEKYLARLRREEHTSSADRRERRDACGNISRNSAIGNGHGDSAGASGGVKPDPV